MTEYKLDIKDGSDPNSPSVFFRRLEKFLKEQRKEEIIQSYLMSTPYVSTTILKGEDHQNINKWITATGIMIEGGIRTPWTPSEEATLAKLDQMKREVDG